MITCGGGGIFVFFFLARTQKTQKCAQKCREVKGEIHQRCRASLGRVCNPPLKRNMFIADTINVSPVFTYKPA